MQGCIPLLLPQPGRTPDTVTSFPDAPKISSRCGQHHTTPGAGPPPAHTRRSAGPGRGHSGSRLLRRRPPRGGNGPSLRKQRHRRRAGSTRMPLLALSLRAAAATAPGRFCPGFAISLRVLFPPTWGCCKAQASTAPAGGPTASSAAGAASLLAPHKHYLSHTLAAVGHLYNKSCVPLVRFRLPFSATCFL